MLCKVKWEGALISASFEVSQVRESKMTSMYRSLVDSLRIGSYRSEGQTKTARYVKLNSGQRRQCAAFSW